MAADDEDATAVVRRFFALLNGRELDEGLGLLAEDGEFWVAGGDGPGSTMTGASLAATFRQVLTGPARDVSFEERSVVAVGGQVVLEAIGSGTLANGQTYRNRYCFVYTVSAGRIVAGREYMDTAHAYRAFSGTQAEGAAS